MSTRKRFSVRELCPQRIRTTDAAGRSRDTWLHAEPAAKNPQMMGRRWAGEFVAQLDKLGTTDRRTAIDAMRRILDGYDNGVASGEMEVNGFGALATDRPEKEFDLSTTATGDDINGANSMAWDGRQRTSDRLALARDVARHSAGISSADYGEIQRRFWSQEVPKQAVGRKG
jgi:hypothetical protein